MGLAALPAPEQSRNWWIFSFCNYQSAGEHSYNQCYGRGRRGFSWKYSAGTGTSARTQTAGATASNSGNIPSSGADANTVGTSGATGSTSANNSGAGGAVLGLLAVLGAVPVVQL